MNVRRNDPEHNTERDPESGQARDRAQASAPTGGSGNEPLTDTCDVFVVGGGPAGLACAIACAMRGMRVIVADGVKPPIDKACGEGLLPDALRALEALGVDVGAVESAQLRGITFFGERDKRGKRAVAKGVFPSQAAIGMRRVLLHDLLIRRAESLGVRLEWQTTVQSIAGAAAGPGHVVEARQGGGRTTVRFWCRFLVGADGHSSRVRTWAGLDRARRGRQRVGLRQHYVVAPWSDGVEVHWTRMGQANVTPVSPEQVCVAFVATNKFADVNAALDHFPDLAARLTSALPADRARSSVTFSRRLRRVTAGSLALLGDASGSVDAVAGEGLALSFHQSLVLAEAIANGDLRTYEREHARLQRGPLRMAAALLLMGRSPRLRVLALQVLSRFPGVFDLLLRLHVKSPARQGLYTQDCSSVASTSRAAATS